MRLFQACLIFLVSVAASAATVTQVVPVFDESLSGLHGSVWQSELRLHNSGSQPLFVTFARTLPIEGGVCGGQLPSPVLLMPLSTTTVAHVGCTGSAAAVEFTADEAVIADNVIVNTGGTLQVTDRCCPIGYQELVPVMSTSVAYRMQHTIINLPGDISGPFAPEVRHIHRMNVGFINSNATAITVKLEYIDTAGYPFVNGATFMTVDVPSMQMVQRQLNLALPPSPVTPPVFQEVWRVNASSTAPFGMYASYVDNATNDATFIAAR